MQAHVQSLAASAGADHGHEPAMPPFARDVYDACIEPVREFFHQNGPKRLRLPTPAAGDPFPEPCEKTTHLLLSSEVGVIEQGVDITPPTCCAATIG